MRLRWIAVILVSLLASPVLAQMVGTWVTEQDSNGLVSKLAVDRRHTLAFENTGDGVAFIIVSPDYLRTQSEDIKAMIRYDSSIPEDFRMVNVDQRQAVVKNETARGIISKIARAKKVDLRIYSHDDDYCDDLVFDTMVFDVPADTPTVVQRVLSGSTN